MSAYIQSPHERISAYITAGMFAAAWLAPGLMGRNYTEGVLLSIMIEFMILIGALTVAAGMAGLGMGERPAGLLFISCGVIYLLVITYGMYQEFGSFMIPVMTVWLGSRSLAPFLRPEDGQERGEPLTEVTYEFSALMLCFMVLFQFPWVPRLGFAFALPYTMSLSSVAPQNLAAMGVAYFALMGYMPPRKFVAWLRSAP
ncbi:MAG: hypothetical protein OEV92_10125 [Nitrospinota bacterium]|nr:hypothetical protein [Nitrospinota bacterium]